mmetsp:Transcript_7601/g.12798  ORF Transcript_7601/g.12798 Transcript_7601/m.12798 type:complete len:774 (-) Transcript_7601:285-2606(-)
MSRRNIAKPDPNDWAAKRKAQIELAKQKREERAMMGDECSEEHTFKPKVNPRPKYLERNRQNSSDSLDMLTGSNLNSNDVFEQPLPGSRPRADPLAGGGSGYQNPPSPSSDALGNEMKRHPHQPHQQSQPQRHHQPQMQQQQHKYPSNEPAPSQSQSPYKSKFMQQYDGEQSHRPAPSATASTSPSLTEDVDANFFGSLRSDSADGGGWNNDTSNVEIPSLGPPKRKVSYRRRKPTDSTERQYPPAPTFSSNRKPAPQHSQSLDPPPWSGDTEFNPESVPPSHYGNRNDVKSTPTSLASNDGDQGFLGNQTAPRQGGDLGQARSRLSLLKTKMRRSDSGSNVMRPNNGEATNLPSGSFKQKSAPSRQQLQQAEDGWNNDLSDAYIPEVPQTKPNRRRQQEQQQQRRKQQQQYEQAESGWNNDISDTQIPDVPRPRSNRRQQPQQSQQHTSGHPPRQPVQRQQQHQQSRWNDASEMESEVGSSSLPGSAQGGYRDQPQQQKPRRQVSAPRQHQHQQQYQQPPQQQYQQQEQHQPRYQQQQPEPQQQQQYQQQQYQQDLPPDAYPSSSDPFAAGNENPPAGEQKQCPDCGRKFNPSPYERHIKICAKVFLEKRKAFDSKKMRIESVAADNPDIVKVLSEKEKEDRRQKKRGGGKKAAAPSGDRAIAAAAKKAKWKADSEAFRAAMRAGKEVSKALATGGPMPEQVASAPDPSLVPCPNCGRTFNEKAAERHIPQCKNIKAKPSSLKRGTGGAGGKNGQVMKQAQGMTKLPGTRRR